MPVELQVAIDITEKERAIDLAKDVSRYVDRIEVGTPLLKKYGLSIIEEVRGVVHGKIIVADMKTMDTGYLETKLAFEAGADVSTILALADDETIKGGIRAAEEYNREIYIDMIGVERRFLEKKITHIHGLGPKWFIIHVGIDEQKRGSGPLDKLRELASLNIDVNIGVAGGIDIHMIKRLKPYTFIKLVIVGAAITSATDPVSKTKEMAEALK
jgi:3-hexulose-6-phosphate synthase